MSPFSDAPAALVGGLLLFSTTFVWSFFASDPDRRAVLRYGSPLAFAMTMVGYLVEVWTH